ncbi:ParB/RepB/Spo0J family partition protein [Candidatus Kaiserbacteria bacterium]|nr:ParB/RepB/Spo0J family partition protein [Candidatus Kaiserbacteria bacterium]
MEEQAYESNSIFWVEVGKIVPNPFQPRREFDEAKLKELAESIRMYGVLQPLVVTRKEVTSADGAFRTEYELIAGERRLRASKLAGIEQVPVIIRSGQETELMKLELAIIENLQREDLNPVDRALAFKQLASQFGLSHADVAKKVGRSRVYVSNSIRLLNLPDTILSALSNGEISDGHARTLLMLSDRPEEQDVIFREILLKKLSVREVEHLSRQIATEKVRKKSPKDLEPELKEMEQKFQESLGTRVQISKTDYGGKVVIDYFSPEDLEQILAVINKKKEEEPNTDEQVAQITSATPLDEESHVEQKEHWVPDEVERVMETPEPIEEPQEAPQEEESSDDDGLYSIKNFSL